MGDRSYEQLFVAQNMWEEGVERSEAKEEKSRAVELGAAASFRIGEGSPVVETRGRWVVFVRL